MLYRRFVLVVAAIALISVSTANLVQFSKTQRDMVSAHYNFSMRSTCQPNRSCAVKFSRTMVNS